MTFGLFCWNIAGSFMVYLLTRWLFNHQVRKVRLLSEAYIVMTLVALTLCLLELPKYALRELSYTPITIDDPWYRWAILLVLVVGGILLATLGICLWFGRLLVKAGAKQGQRFGTWYRKRQNAAEFGRLDSYLQDIGKPAKEKPKSTSKGLQFIKDNFAFMLVAELLIAVIGHGAADLIRVFRGRK